MTKNCWAAMAPRASAPMKTKWTRLEAVAMAGLLALLAGCATSQDAQSDYVQGWRVGEVERIGTGTERFPITGVDCRGTDTRTAGIAAQRYAYVEFIHAQTGSKYFYSGPTQRHVLVPIPVDSEYRVGEYVYVNIRDCGLPLRHWHLVGR